MKYADVMNWEFGPVVKDCGHANCHLGTKLCCECEDKRPLAKKHQRYVDGKGMVSVGMKNGMTWGYCPGCKFRLRLAGEKRCFCGVVGCDLTTSDWCCACLDARPADTSAQYTKGQLRLTYRGMHYCSNCVKLKKIVKERKNAVKHARAALQTEGKKPAVPMAKAAVSPPPASRKQPVVVPARTETESPLAKWPVFSPRSDVPSIRSPSPVPAYGSSHIPSGEQRDGNAAPLTEKAHISRPPLVSEPTKSAISGAEVDNEFVLSEKVLAIEVPVDFEVVEHSEVAEMGWKTTRGRWYSMLWKH